MDDAAFDALTRTAGRVGSRRRLLTLLGGGLAAAVAAVPVRGAVAQDRRCERWVLSGGPEGTEPIGVDDQLWVYVNGDKVYGERDDRAGFVPPITFRAREGQKLRLVARDVVEPCFQLNAVYLKCARGDGRARRLDRGVSRTCDRQQPKGIFFNKTFDIE